MKIAILKTICYDFLKVYQKQLELLFLYNIALKVSIVNKN